MQGSVQKQYADKGKDDGMSKVQYEAIYGRG